MNHIRTIAVIAGAMIAACNVGEEMTLDEMLDNALDGITSTERQKNDLRVIFWVFVGLLPQNAPKPHVEGIDDGVILRWYQDEYDCEAFEVTLHPDDYEVEGKAADAAQRLARLRGLVDEC